MKKSLLLIFLSTMLVQTYAAEIGFSGDVSLVSTYVFRGLKQFEGAALQSTAEFSYGPITGGLWMSSFNGPLVVENDPYVTLTLPTGDFETQLGVTLYSYDFFARREYTVYELSAGFGYGPFSFGAYYLPAQSYKKDLQTIDLVSDPLYWLEIGAETTFKGAELSAQLGAGTYSAYFTTGNNEKSTICLLLGIGKKLNEHIAVRWNWNLALDEYTENCFFLSAGYTF
ncbi:MAG: hypothetical protein ONB12_12515 [candidate division KSB1 bacterium]|nr:hypothetical protein [candidate division KSB1 bacterium]